VLLTGDQLYSLELQQANTKDPVKLARLEAKLTNIVSMFACQSGHLLLLNNQLDA
jgi:hypothetical protein